VLALALAAPQGALALDPLAAAGARPPDRLGLAERLAERIEDRLSLWTARIRAGQPLSVLRLPRRLEAELKALQSLGPRGARAEPPGASWRLLVSSEAPGGESSEPLWDEEVARRITDPVQEARVHLDRALTPMLSAGLSLHVLRSPSALRAYEYQNHVVGVYLHVHP
jgi:hypothetical protein